MTDSLRTATAALKGLRRVSAPREAVLLVLATGLTSGVLVLAPAPARAATNGRIAFEVPPDAAPSIETVNPDGTNPQPLLGAPRDSANPAWTADGTRLAFSSTVNGSPDVYVINADGTGLRRVTADPLGAIDPTWSPDGRFIAFTSLRNGKPDIYVADLAGGSVSRLTTDPAVDEEPRWSPDGRLIAFVSSRGGSFGIWTMAPDGSNQRPLTSQPGASSDPAWSPDGARLAYTNDVAGFRSLFSIDRSGGGEVRLTRGHGTDQFPAWSPDGAQIAFTRDGGLYVMSSKGELISGLQLLSPSAVDPVWAALPVPVATSATGAVTVRAPGSAGPRPIGAAPDLPTGTRVDAADGSVVVSFRLQTAPAALAPSTALVQNAVFTVVKRTPENLSLRLQRPVCGSRVASTARRRRRRTPRVTIRGGHQTTITREVIVASHLTAYLVAESCRGTLVSVTKGLVVVRVRRGRRRTVRVPAGHSFFAPA